LPSKSGYDEFGTAVVQSVGATMQDVYLPIAILPTSSWITWILGFVMFFFYIFIIVISETLRMTGISCYIVNLLWKLEI